MRRLAVLWALLWSAASVAAGPVELVLPGQPVKPSVEARLIVPGSPQALNAKICPLPATLVPFQPPAPPQVIVPGQEVRQQAALPRLQAAAAGLEKAPEQSLSALFGDEPTDGKTVSPRLALPGEGVTPAQVQLLSALKHSVAQALPSLKASVALGDWNGPGTTLNTPCCGDAAPKLALMLRKAGYPAHVVEAEFHYYVLVDFPAGRFVVDPTVRQFFGGPKAPQEIPPVFVGSYDELHAFFTAHAAQRSSKFPFSRIYFSEAKTADHTIAELLADPARPDLAPLSARAAN